MAARSRKIASKPLANSTLEQREKKEQPESARRKKRNETVKAASADTARVRKAPETAEKKGHRETKSDVVLNLLRSKDGCSLDELVAATGWQAHSVRGFLSGSVRKKMGLAISSTKTDGGKRRYRLAAEPV